MMFAKPCDGLLQLASGERYRQAVGEKEMRLDLIEFFVEVQTLLLTPVSAHVRRVEERSEEEI